MSEFRNILLVEDEPLLAEHEAAWLRSKGYIVILASTGEEAIAKVEAATHQIDLIVMDIYLGKGMNGGETAREILKAYDIPIIFLLAQTESDALKHTEEITSYGYVFKDSNLALLAATIRTAFQLHDAHRNIHRVTDHLHLRVAQQKVIEEEMERFINSLPDMVCIASTDGYFKKLNREWERVLGYTQEELLAKPFADFIHPDDREATFKVVEQQLKGRSTFHFINRYQARDGSYHLFEWNGTPSPDGIMLFAAARDITEHKRTEDQLRQQSDWLRWVSDAVISTDTNLLITEWNQAAVDIYGWNSEEAIGRNMDELLQTKFVDASQADAQKILTETGLWRGQVSQQTKSGQKLYIEASVTFLRDGSGNITGGITINRDVTQRKQAEEALRETEAKWRRMFELLPVGVSIVDSKNQILEINPALGQILSLSTENLLQGNYADRRYLRPDHKIMPQEEFPSLRAIKEQSAVRDVEIGVEKKDGSIIWTSVSAAPFVPGKSTVTVTVDITARKQAEASLQQALADKDILMHELQHRIKNSLAIAASFLALEEANLPDEKTRAIFASTQSRIYSMAAIYEQLYHAGEFDQLDLREYIEKLVLRLSESYIPETGPIQIKTHLENVELDLERTLSVGIILNELIVNALKHAFPAGATPQNGPATIRVEMTRNEKTVKISVSDNGVGMPGDARGSGLGLELVKMLTRQIYGSFGVENDEGCMVWVTFEQN